MRSVLYRRIQQSYLRKFYELEKERLWVLLVWARKLRKNPHYVKLQDSNAKRTYSILFFGCLLSYTWRSNPNW